MASEKEYNPFDNSTMAPCGVRGVDHYTKAGTPRVRNKYAGMCGRCGHPVAAGQGCVQMSNGAWNVYCLEQSVPNANPLGVQYGWDD